jgi:minor extracellular serine protease Vpr
MVRFLRFAALTAIACSVLAVPFFRSDAVTNNSTVSVIVELSDDPGAVFLAKAKRQGALVSDDQMRSYRNGLTATQDQFLKALQSQGISFQLQTVNVKDAAGNVAGSVPMRYTLAYNGMTLAVPAAAVPTLAKMAGVKAVHANRVFHPDMFKSVPYIRAPQLYGKNPNNMTPFASFPDGDQGQGIYIAVIDTGIDWTHPMFGGDPTPPRLGIGLNSAAVPSNQKVVYSLPLADIVTDGFGHGTHVASEAAGYLANAPGPDGLPGTADDIPIHGVAPQAKLMSYKVCSDSLSTAAEGFAVVQSATGIGVPVGGCLSSTIIMSIEDAVSPQTIDLQPKPIANVINMSLGGGGGPDEPTAVASDNATLMGCSVVAAAGNSGPDEATVGAPAAGRRVLSAAANTDPGSGGDWSTDLLVDSAVSAATTGAVTPANNLATAPGSNRMKLVAMSGSASLPDNSLAQRYVYVDNPTVAWPATVAGRIALVNSILTGGTFFDIALQAQNAGAVGVIIADDRGAVNGVKTLIPAATISTSDFAVLASHVANTNGAISDLPMRMNPRFSDLFIGDVADFSSRGPVQGFGQIKPDISAPGVNVLAAAPTASVVWALANSGPMYATISGTSMATPHTAGSVALIRQAHPEWTPDMIRTAMINAATNMRDANGAPKADGSADSIIGQGGGLIDVYHAARIKALMGSTEDDGKGSFLLGSHSYGEVPVANNRVTSTQSVTVTIQDLSGQGGTYNLGVADNKDLQINGISVATSPASVTVPANGSATFAVNTTFDGNLIRDPNLPITIVNGTQVTFSTRPIETQWYVTAQRSDGGESLRMPFYYKPTFSLPLTTSTDTSTFTGTVAVGDLDLEVQPGVDFVDIPVTVDSTTSKLDAELNYFPTPVVSNQIVNQNVELDFYLLDPAGKRIAHSANSSGAQRISAITVNRPGTYTYRVDGNQCAATNFTITSTRTHGNTSAPALQTIPGDFVNSQNQHVDFDGSFNINWTPNGGEQGFEVEQSTDNQNWQILGDVSGTTNNLAASNLANGTYYFRARAFYPGQIGLFVTDPGNVVSVVVDQRSQVDITSLVTKAISNVSLSGGVFQLDLAMTNGSAQAYVPLIDLNVVGINSPSGSIKVINADNGKDGKSQANAARFGYSQAIGPDEQFTPNEVTATRTFRFQDNASEMFTFDANVTAYLPGGGSSSNSSSSSASSPPPSGSTSVGLLPLTQLKAVMRFTVNPLTKTVTAQLIKLK